MALASQVADQIVGCWLFFVSIRLEALAICVNVPHRSIVWLLLPCWWGRFLAKKRVPKMRSLETTIFSRCQIFCCRRFWFPYAVSKIHSQFNRTYLCILSLFCIPMEPIVVSLFKPYRDSQYRRYAEGGHMTLTARALIAGNTTLNHHVRPKWKMGHWSVPNIGNLGYDDSSSNR